jgi:hypothetical protein
MHKIAGINLPLLYSHMMPDVNSTKIFVFKLYDLESARSLFFFLIYDNQYFIIKNNHKAPVLRTDLN